MSDWSGDVVRFWFGQSNDKWWKAEPAFDAEVRERYEALWEEKRQLPVHRFLGHPLTALAAVVLFDQFPRHMFRGHAEQFATDHLALAVAREAVDRGLDDQLEPRERGILYMPFQHSERLADQRRSVQLFTALGDESQLGFARKHHDIIARFGRFPHRNAMLGRAPRPDEVAAGEVLPW
ncbi:MAG TPA: DUF924 family protein [Sphingomicrobium sp.]|nr:DUF924 family protein [Sphingomicrobium sp.]